MDPVLAEIYSTVLGGAPFVIAAYALCLVAILVYVVYVMRRMKMAEKRLAALEEHVAEITKA